MKEKKPSSLLQRIFEIRKAKGVSLDSLGNAMGGVTKSTASSIENGDVPLKAEYIPAIAKLLGVSPWELFIDYDSGETGPLNEQEKALILNFRHAASDTERKVIEDVAEQFAKR